MKRLLIITVLLWYTIDSVAQPYLNQVYVYGKTFNVALGILVEDDGYVVVCNGYTENTGSVSYRAGIILYKIAFNGDTIWRTVHNRPGKACTIGWYGSLVKSDNAYLIGGSCRDTITDDYDYYLAKFDSSGHEIFWKDYPKPALQNCLHGSLTGDGGYIMAGETYIQNVTDRDFYVLKVDSNGSKEWDKTYDGGDDDQAFQIFSLSGDQYLVSGPSRSFGPGVRGAWLLKIDKEGNQVWSKSYGTAGEDAFGITIPSATGYLIWGGGDTVVYNTQTQYNEMIYKIDTSGRLQWRTFFNHQKSRTIWQCRELPDGNIIAMGQQRTGIFDSTQAWIAKLNSSGDVLWERFYYYDTKGDPLYLSSGYFKGDFQQTPDGGFVIAGNVSKADSSAPNQFFEQFWLVKLDSNGCMGPDDCGVDVGVGIGQALSHKPLAVSVFPNPASEFVKIYIKGNSAQWANEEIAISLYNLSGQQLYTENRTLNSSAYTETQLKTAHLPPGVYVYSVTSGEEVLSEGKVVVE